jgi:hypothetical protein
LCRPQRAPRNQHGIGRAAETLGAAVGPKPLVAVCSVWVVEHELIELSGPQSINTGGLVAPYGVGLGRGSSSPIGWRSPSRPPTLRLPLPAVAGLATILLTVERGRVPLIPISAAVASAGPDTTLIRVHPVDGLVVFVLISVLLSPLSSYERRYGIARKGRRVRSVGSRRPKR